MASSNYLNLSSRHVDSLIDYVRDTKPFRSKLSAVVEKYNFTESIIVNLSEEQSYDIFLGPDILPAEGIAGRRSRESNTWLRDIVSDGSRSTWPVPLTIVNKFYSDASKNYFTPGVNDFEIFPGLTAGTFDPVRWDGPTMRQVKVGDSIQQDGVDYFLSHGAFIFETLGGTLWKEETLLNIPEIPSRAGILLYEDVVRSYGAITGITGGNYEEWVLTCVSASPVTLNVVGSSSGNIGTVVFGQNFAHSLINFTFTAPPGETESFAEVGDQFTLTPFNKITLSPTTPQETWSLIKVNPIGLAGSSPQFFDAGSKFEKPALTVNPRSLDRVTTPMTWSLKFSSPTVYTLTAVPYDEYGVSQAPIVIPDISLSNGLSYSDERIEFTIVPSAEPFQNNDEFTWATDGVVENYLVYGSVSGWQQNAKVGQWYWNGKIGFKIPKLEYWARSFNSTILTSATAQDGSWTTTVSNDQILTGVDYNQQFNLFFVVGPENVVAASADGSSWTGNLSSIMPAGNAGRLVILGQNGVVAISTDGETWYSRNTGVPFQLNAVTEIQDALSEPGSPGSPTINLLIAVGNNGSIVTSTSGDTWAARNSGTTDNLNDIAWTNDAIIVVGQNGRILKSDDRINWTTVPSGVTSNLNSIVFAADRNMFIAVGDNGTIIKSTNAGATWSNLAVFSDGNFSDIAYGSGKFIIVSRDGWVVESVDGISWTRYLGQKHNSVAFGNGVFVAVGGRASSTEQFVPLKPVHSIAEPSVYTVTFINSQQATVQNNIYGFRDSLTVGQPWSDEFCSFRIDALPSGLSYTRGDCIKISLAPSKLFPMFTGFYDESGYDIPLYDLSVRDGAVAKLYNQEIFPLSRGHGTIIFKSAPSELVQIDRATRDIVRLKIKNSSINYPDLAAVDDWIPLSFKYYKDTTAVPAIFPEQVTLIEARLGSNSDRVAFTISQPRASVGKYTGAVLTFNADFVRDYLQFGEKFSLMFLPDGHFGQKMRVKITENLWSFARIGLDLEEQMPVNVQIYEADVNSDGTSASVIEGLSIVERVSGVNECCHVNYIHAVDGQLAGRFINVEAASYVVTHDFTGGAGLPSVRLESTSSPGVFVMVTPSPNTYPQLPSAISEKSFKFSLPPGITAPFKMKLL